MDLNAYPYRVTVTRIAATVTGLDAYGNDSLTEVRRELAAQACWPTDVVEDTDGRQTVTSGMKLVLDPGTSVGQQDRFEIGGVRFEVTAVQDWTNVRNPWTGEGAGVEVTLKRVTG